MPFNLLVGIRVSAVHKDGVTIECEVTEKLMNGAGVLHGGVAATLADVAVGMAVSRELGAFGHATTSELKINYLRPIVAGRVRARARLLRVGSTLCVGRVDVTDAEKKLACVAIVTYVRLDGKR